MEIRFKLNQENEKDKVILEFLSKEYAPSITIKNILYKMALDGVEGNVMEVKNKAESRVNHIHIEDVPSFGERGSSEETRGVIEEEFNEYFN